MINNKYSEFLPSMQSAEDLVAQVEGLASNIDLLRAGIENEVTPGGHSAPFHPKSGAPTPSWGGLVTQGMSEQDFHGRVLWFVDDPGAPFQLRRFGD